MAKKENTKGQAQALESQDTDIQNMMTTLTAISGFKTDIATLSAQQNAFIAKQDDDIKPIATQLCMNGNKREYSEVDFMFSIYAFHCARYAKNSCSVQSTLKVLPDCFGIDGSETDVENVRKSFKAFDKFNMNLPENYELFRKFGVTKLRILSMVHDSNVDKVITAISNGELRPDITVSNLRDKVKEFNGTKNRINLDYTEKNSGSKTENKLAENSGSETENQPAEKPVTDNKTAEISEMLKMSIADIIDTITQTANDNGVEPISLAKAILAEMTK